MDQNLRLLLAVVSSLLIGICSSATVGIVSGEDYRNLIRQPRRVQLIPGYTAPEDKTNIDERAYPTGEFQARRANTQQKNKSLKSRSFLPNAAYQPFGPSPYLPVSNYPNYRPNNFQSNYQHGYPHYGNYPMSPNPYYQSAETFQNYQPYPVIQQFRSLKNKVGGVEDMEEVGPAIIVAQRELPVPDKPLFVEGAEQFGEATTQFVAPEQVGEVVEPFGPIEPIGVPNVLPSDLNGVVPIFPPSDLNGVLPIFPPSDLNGVVPIFPPSEPFEKVTEPIVAPSEPIEEVTEPIFVLNEPFEEVTEPIVVPSEPIEEVYEPIVVPSKPIEEVVVNDKVEEPVEELVPISEVSDQSVKKVEYEDVQDKFEHVIEDLADLGSLFNAYNENQKSEIASQKSKNCPEHPGSIVEPVIIVEPNNKIDPSGADERKVPDSDELVIVPVPIDVKEPGDDKEYPGGEALEPKVPDSDELIIVPVPIDVKEPGDNERYPGDGELEPKVPDSDMLVIPVPIDVNEPDDDENHPAGEVDEPKVPDSEELVIVPVPIDVKDPDDDETYPVGEVVDPDSDERVIVEPIPSDLEELKYVVHEQHPAGEIVDPDSDERVIVEPIPSDLEELKYVVPNFMQIPSRFKHKTAKERRALLLDRHDAQPVYRQKMFLLNPIASHSTLPVVYGDKSPSKALYGRKILPHKVGQRFVPYIGS